MELCNYCSIGFPQTTDSTSKSINKGCIRMDSTETSIGLNIAGVVLAGGESRRMGSLKEGLRLWDGRSMIEHVIGTIRMVCPEIIVVGNCSGYDLNHSAGVHHIGDLHPGLGPLAGIESALSSGIAQGYIIMACDQPLVTPHILARLIADDPSCIHVFTDDGTDQIEPFPGYYPADCLTLVQNLLDTGERKVRFLIDGFTATRIPISEIDKRLLKNINTPADLDSVMNAAAEAFDEKSARR